jgi:acetolactate synthase-1/2/3 large subunit
VSRETVERSTALQGHPRTTGGDAVLGSLLAAGVDHAFSVPGESFMGLLAAMHRDHRIRPISTRHEEGAAFMAVGYARIAGRPAVAMGTRMVGAANLAIGIHTAYQDSVPMIAILGQSPTAYRFREAFQEVDLSSVFAPLAKVAIPARSRATGTGSSSSPGDSRGPACCAATCNARRWRHPGS